MSGHITAQYTVKRADLGKQPLFCMAGPEMCDSIPMNTAEHKKFILRNPVSEAVQFAPVFKQHEVNTKRVGHTEGGTNHAEGGWPKDVNIHDPEATERYRKKIQRDDGYIHSVIALYKEFDYIVKQNNAIDMYRSFFAEIDTQPELEKRSVRTVNEYRDSFQRPVSSIAWQPDGHRFAVTYVDVDFDRVSRGPVAANIWDIDKPMAAEQVIIPPCPLLDLVYNPKDANVLAGGLMSGQVGAWDTRVGGDIQSICEPFVAHRGLVRNVIFIASKSGLEFFSASDDGTCKWWDMRNMSSTKDEMILDGSGEEPRMEKAAGVSILEYEHTIPTRFMVGTDKGVVLGANRKGKSPTERIPLTRSPAFLKNFLTVGDWTVKVWAEECRDSPLLWSPGMRHRFTSGAWSPTRVSLMTLTSYDGHIYIWDMLRKQYQAVVSQKVSPAPILKQKFHDGGSLIAMGNKIGTIYMEELSMHLTGSDKNDKLLMQAVLDRETKRERILESRLREIKLKLRQAEEGEEVRSLGEDPAAGDRDLIEATSDYFEQVKKEIKI